MNKITIFLIAVIVMQLFQVSARANQCLQKITTAIENNTKNSPAVGLLVIKDGKTLYKKANGLAEIENQIKATNQTSFPLISITQMMTASAILKLEEQGKLSIDDKASKYLKLLPKEFNDIKISNLLFHTSGLPNYLDYNDNKDVQNNFGPYVDDEVKTSITFNRKYITEFIKKQNLKFKSGQEFYWSSTNYWLLARIIENTSGKSYSDYINDHIFKKIDAKNSYILNSKNKNSTEIKSYLEWPMYKKYINKISENFPDSDGDAGVIMSFDDFELYINNFFLKNGMFTKNETQKRFIAPVVDSWYKNKFGFGMFHSSYKHNKIHAGGFAPFYHTVFAHYTDKNLTVAILSGSEITSYATTNMANEIVRCF